MFSLHIDNRRCCDSEIYGEAGVGKSQIMLQVKFCLLYSAFVSSNWTLCSSFYVYSILFTKEDSAGNRYDQTNPSIFWNINNNLITPLKCRFTSVQKEMLRPNDWSKWLTILQKVSYIISKISNSNANNWFLNRQAGSVSRKSSFWKYFYRYLFLF